MAQSKILLDTASYLRLAKSIHPLLFVTFGTENHCLYVLKELDDEVLRSRRLKTKFPWVSEVPYCQNRKTRLTLSKADGAAIAQAEEFLWDHVVNELPGPSRIDCKALAHGFVLTIPVVTDDQDMRALAAAFEIQTLSTLRLIALMQSCNHVTIETIRSMVRFWLYELDLPAGCRDDYAELFGEPFLASPPVVHFPALVIAARPQAMANSGCNPVRLDAGPGNGKLRTPPERIA